jgi:hypothetical protein
MPGVHIPDAPVKKDFAMPVGGCAGGGLHTPDEDFPLTFL